MVSTRSVGAQTLWLDFSLLRPPLLAEMPRSPPLCSELAKRGNTSITNPSNPSGTIPFFHNPNVINHIDIPVQIDEPRTEPAARIALQKCMSGIWKRD